MEMGYMEILEHWFKVLLNGVGFSLTAIVILGILFSGMVFAIKLTVMCDDKIFGVSKRDSNG